MKKMEEDIKQTLKDIMIFIGADIKYAEYAQIQSYLEGLIERNS